MRVPSELPEPRQPKSSNRRRTVIAVVVGVLLILAVSLKGLASFYTDYLWFDQLGFGSIFTGLLWVKVGLGVVFTGVFFLLMFVNLTLAERMAPRFRPGGPDEEFLERYHELVGDRQRVVRVAVSTVLAVIAGAGVSSEWNNWILFRNRVDFGVSDPQFGIDAGFYVFQLPFVSFTVNWLFMALVIVLVITATAHYLSGGIRIQSPAPERVTPQVKAHISVLLAMLALVKTADYWLQRYELNFSTRGVVDGASYTDVNAQLPAIQLLIVISLTACGLFIVNIWRRGWTLPVVAVGLWAFVALLAGSAYPAFIQQFQVRPDESTREAPYIANNIELTRYAMGVDDVTEQSFVADTKLDLETVEVGGPTVRNLPLVDPDIVIDTFQQLQAALSIHQIVDLDVDRYPLGEPDGELTQVVTATRELNTDGNPESSWVRNHLAFTHGFGTVVAQGNRDDTNGDPAFLMQNTTLDRDPRFEPELDRPHVYYGEETHAYAVVGTTRDEVTAEEDNKDVTFRYDGEGGVGLTSTLRRAAFALRFNDLEVMISDFITDDSRVLYKRTVHDRVTSVAPFLSFDRDPYAVLAEGRIKWIVDGYTTTNRFPYAQRADVGKLPAGSDLRRPLNYVRNSVKAVVDAYDGTVELYIMPDPATGEVGDPIIKAYRQAFPTLFQSVEEMSDELRAHIRYPKDLFTLQTEVWSRYHLSDPGAFYDRTRAWEVAQAPSSDLIQSARQVTAAVPAEDGASNLPTTTGGVAPYYVQLTLPGSEELEYVVLRPFVRASTDGDTKSLLSAFMVASSELDSYGRLNVYEMTSQGIEGPTIVDSNIRSDQTVALVLNRLSEGGSEVKAGNLFLVPMGEDNLMWVRPVYVQARGGDDVVEVPQLRFVIVVSDAGVIMQPSFSAAMNQSLIQSGYTRSEARSVLEPIFGVVDSPTDILANLESDGETGDPPSRSSTTTTTVPVDTTEPSPTTRPGGDTGGGSGEELDEILKNQEAILELLREMLAGSTPGTTVPDPTPRTTSTTVANDEA